MSSKIRNLYVRLFQMVAALYFGALIGTVVEQEFKCAYDHSVFYPSNFWIDVADTPVKLATILLTQISLPEKIVWSVFFVVCGIYVFQPKNIKWIPVLISILACLWTYFEAKGSSF